MSDDIILEIEDDYIGSAYNPQIAVDEIAGGHQVSMTYQAPEGLTTETFDVMDGVAAGFGEPTATVDANVGTPSVEISASGPDTAKVFAFAFHNMKGEQGIQGETGATGQDGAAAGFGSVSATVDANVGIPSVDVTASGPDTAKQFAFAFHNIKGDKGDKGATGATGETGQTGAAAGFGTPTATVDATVGTPSVSVSASGPDTAKVFAFAFSNLKGDKGDTGDPAAAGSIGTTELADGAVTVGKLASGVTDLIASKAAQDGAYSMLSAGSADGIPGEAQTGTFLQRACPTRADGIAEIESIKGNTVVWNQLVTINNLASGTYQGITIETEKSTGKVSISGTAEGDVYLSIGLAIAINFVVGHKYIALPSDGSYSTFRFYISSSNSPTGATLNFSDAAPFTATNAASIVTLTCGVRNGVHVDGEYYPQIFDLTEAYGAGNEPSTVAQFEATYKESYYPYCAPKLLSNTMQGIATEDADGDALGSLSIPVSTYFPNGMRSAGTARDELQADKAITRVGTRAYQSGDESDSTLTTDGSTYTNYPLATPTTTPIDPPLDMRYLVEAGGTESLIVDTSQSAPQSAPAIIETRYPESAASIRDLALSAIAPIENGKASTNYAVGSYLVHNGTLCKVTSAIASGESITIGTNVTATTVMAEVIALTS